MGRIRLTLDEMARSPVASGVAVAAIAILSWPLADGPARTGVDPSWEAGLHLAIENGIRFGPELVFTYGPLGFLAWAWPWFGPTSFLAYVFTATIHLALCAVIFLGARRVLPFWPAVVVGYLGVRAVMVLQPFEGLLVIVFAICVGLLLRRRDPLPTWLIALGGLATAFGLLGKLNTGVFITAIVVVTVLATTRRRARGLLVLVASAGGASLVLWLAGNGRLEDIGAYILGVYEIVSGYSQGMSAPGRPVVMVLYLALVLLVARIAAVEASDRPLASRIGLAAIGLIMAFAFFKVGFVRSNLEFMMAAVVVALFAVSSGRTRRAYFLTAFGAVLVASIATVRVSSPILASPLAVARALAVETRVAVVPWAWPAAEARTREQLRSRYAVEPAILDALRGHTVSVDPWEAAVLEAYPELRWRPLPVFQSYSAYTPTLDELNASVLRGPDAPERILRRAVEVSPAGVVQPVTIEGRDRWFEAPAAMLETFCRYDEVAATTRWEVLGRTGRHCGASEPLATVVAAAGETVAVPQDPRPDRFVVARVSGVDDRLVDRLITSAYASPQWYATLDGTDRVRLVPGTAGDGLLLAVPSSTVRSPGFGFDRRTRSIAIAPVNALVAPGPLTYEFLSIPLVSP
jgi:hypothetical protein